MKKALLFLMFIIMSSFCYAEIMIANQTTTNSNTNYADNYAGSSSRYETAQCFNVTQNATLTRLTLKFGAVVANSASRTYISIVPESDINDLSTYLTGSDTETGAYSTGDVNFTFNKTAILTTGITYCFRFDNNATLSVNNYGWQGAGNSVKVYAGNWYDSSGDAAFIKKNFSSYFKLYGSEYYAKLFTINTGGYVDYSQASDITEKKNISLNITNLNNILKNSCNCIGCAIIGSNCRIPINFYSQNTSNITVSLLNATYSYGIDNCSNSDNIPSNATTLNISFYDQTTLSAIPLDSSGIFNYNPFGTALSYSFSNTNKYSTLYCIYPNWLNLTVDGQIALSKTDYISKMYYLTGPTILNLNNNTQYLKLYLTATNASTTTKITWLTNSYISVTGTLYLYQCAGNSTRTLLETVQISNGVSYVNLNLLSTLYSYSVLYNGVLYEDFNGYSKCHTESANEISYFINTETTDISQPIGMYSIVCNMTKSGNTTVLMSWNNNPQSALTITGCLFAYRNGINGWVETYSDCINDSYSIERTIPYTGYSYEVRGIIYQGGYSLPCSDVVSFAQENNTSTKFNLTGIFAIIILVFSCALFFVGDDLKQNAGAIIGIIISWFLGLFAFDWSVISSMCAFILLIMWVGRSASKR